MAKLNGFSFSTYRVGNLNDNVTLCKLEIESKNKNRIQHDIYMFGLVGWIMVILFLVILLLPILFIVLLLKEKVKSTYFLFI